MNKLSKIIQVTPGNIPIPTKGWGAVEKVIWEYKKSLNGAGYEVEILYADEVAASDGQIVHVHMANLANILHERGVEYVFSLHDHHVEHFGKESECYRENYRAIKNSRLTFVHSPHLVGYFDSMPNIVYLQHGANTTDYLFQDRSRKVRSGASIMMMANNGLGGDPLVDRKGFLLGIEAARKLRLPITILCPGTNRQFFEHHSPQYEQLEVKYDVDYEGSVEEMSRHTVFLNPSVIEAGHPNLTVVESVSTGMPVVGTSCVDFPGLVRCERDVESIVAAVSGCIRRYDSLVESMRDARSVISWDIVVTKMLQHYKKAFAISEKSQLEWQYSSTRRLLSDKQEKSGIQVDFRSGRAFLKTSLFSEGLSAVFRDSRTNTILYETVIGKTPGCWAYMPAPHDRFVEWEVSVNFGTVPVHVERMDLRDRKVLVTGVVDEKALARFCVETGCLVTLRDVQSPVFCHDPEPDPEAFYTVLNSEQVMDYFVQRPRRVDRYLLVSSSSALGDTIAFIPYAQKWAESRNIAVDVDCSWSELFLPSDYPNLNFVGRGVDTFEYSQLYRFEYQFDRSLQRGYCDQFGLEFEEIRPTLKRSGLRSPERERYVCIGVQTTTQCKYWNRPNGWSDLCRLLAKTGIKVVAVDKYEVFGIEGYWNTLPDNAKKKVGMDFSEVVRYVEHCDLFIGVSSGLSWLAHGLNKPVVMVSGTTYEKNEFNIDNTRVFPEPGVCSGCFNRPHMYRFDPSNWLWCPEHAGTAKHFECTKTISPERVYGQVMKVLNGES